MFDIAVNLTSSQFAKDHQAVLQRAKAAGVTGMLITGTDIQHSKQASDWASLQKGYCWATAGVHPHHASSWNDDSANQLRALASAPEVVAIGECGLDFNRNFSSPGQQEAAFEAQLALAAELGLVVFLHCREAHERFIALLTPWLKKLPGAVVHCFTGTQKELEQCLALGLAIGITGWVCDERRGLDLRALLPYIPITQLLVETDAPYLLPRDLFPKPSLQRNEPCFLPHIIHQIAHWRKEDPLWLGQKVDENARQLFQLV